LKKNCEEVRFFSPSSIEITSLIDNITTKENLIIKNDSEIYEQIINFSQFDIRRLINILQELSYHFNKIDSPEMLKEFFEKSRKKNVNPRLEGNQYFGGRLTGFPRTMVPTQAPVSGFRPWLAGMATWLKGGGSTRKM
jgi:hypothetical protein